MNILARTDLTYALGFLHSARPLVVIAAFLPHHTYEENLTRTRALSGTAGVASSAGKVYTGNWTSQAGWRDALIAVPVNHNKTEAAPTIIRTWLKEFEQNYYLFRPADGNSLLYVPTEGAEGSCQLDRDRIVLPDGRTFVIEAAYDYPGYFAAWALWVGVKNGNPRVWDRLL